MIKYIIGIEVGAEEGSWTAMKKDVLPIGNDVGEFRAFAGHRSLNDMRTVVRAHVIAWRKDLESRGLSPASIRHKLSAVSSLFDYLCERNAVIGNPVDGVKRPMANGNDGSTPALGDAQARKLLEAPPADTLKGIRDRAVLAKLLYHGIRREELCGLKVRDQCSLARGRYRQGAGMARPCECVDDPPL